MALDIGTEDRARPSPAHEIGQELDLLSVHELDERIAALQAEIERLEAAKSGKEASKRAADSFFKS
jgi:uncharacterized small protein (DUF1192 family)